MYNKEIVQYFEVIRWDATKSQQSSEKQIQQAKFYGIQYVLLPVALCILLISNIIIIQH